MSSFSEMGATMILEDTGRYDAALCTALADEIRAIRTLVECVADVLVADERFVTDYIEQFQLFDLIVQHADESATLLDRMAEGQSVGEAIERVRLHVVQDRLRAATMRK
jgi:nitrogen-specific signal transduction histidine kinase